MAWPVAIMGHYYGIKVSIANTLYLATVKNLYLTSPLTS